MSLLPFIHELQWKDIPEPIRQEAIRSLLDTVGSVVVGRSTEAARIMREYAVTVLGGKGSFLWLDGREVSPPAAACANAMMADAVGIYGGHPLAKGTAAGPLLATLFATLPEQTTGQELLTIWVMGLEIAWRAGIALHNSTPEAHAASTWNILGNAAIAARQLHLTGTQTQHALGIAEYTAPRALVADTIAFPSMLRTGAAWAAMGGVTAAMLAKKGFTGTIPSAMRPTDMSHIWDDLGKTWQLATYYYKPYASNRWIHPSLDAALAIRDLIIENLDQVQQITVYTFQAVLQDLPSTFPSNMVEAQFDLRFCVSAILVYGTLNQPITFNNAFKDEQVRRLFSQIQLIEEERYTNAYPAQRLARVVIQTQSGAIYDSGTSHGKWTAEVPPTDEELKQKFRTLTQGALADSRANMLEQLILHCSELESIDLIIRILQGN